MADIFISYAREDSTKARLLAETLEQHGWSVFWDRTAILPGQDFDQVIEQAINQARFMIVGWSNAAKTSDWVRGEATVGRERRVLLPVLFEPVEPPIAFRSLHTEDFSNWHGEPDAPVFQALIKALRPKHSQPVSAGQTATHAKQSHADHVRPRYAKLWLGIAIVVVALGAYLTADHWLLMLKKLTAAHISVSLMPDMVEIPAGEFWMGAAQGNQKDAEKAVPRHRVHVDKFALGKFEVTKAQFAEFVRQTGYTASNCWVWHKAKWLNQSGQNWQTPGFVQTESDPVVCVSHDDALSYIHWLTQQTGRQFRLPSEAEWEYAARAGSLGDYYWATEPAADYAWFNRNSDSHPHAVGQKKPNAFGLYDMAGNVWEWLADCWHKNYINAPNDGSVWKEADGGDCSRRALRGGSWFYGSDDLRSFDRGWNNPIDRNSDGGFRLAHDAP